jgi:hypothetical protein
MYVDDGLLIILDGSIDQRLTVKIENYALLLSGEVSDEEQDDTTMYKTRRKNKATVIRSDILHQRDFYCVGSNVWSLVSEKFGSEIELGCKVVSQVARNPRHQSRISESS